MVIVAVVIGVLVLARMSTPGSTAATTSSSTATPTTAASAGTTTSIATTTTVATSSTTTTTVAPSTVTVLVLNGWTTAHGALYFQMKLSKQGYDTLAPNNAATNTVKLSKIYICKGTAKSTNAYQVAGIVGVARRRWCTRPRKTPRPYLRACSKWPTSSSWSGKTFRARCQPATRADLTRSEPAGAVVPGFG